MTIVLLWHRFTWGFAEWIHETTFYNFWSGTYVIIAGKQYFISFSPVNTKNTRKEIETSLTVHQELALTGISSL